MRQVLIMGLLLSVTFSSFSQMVDPTPASERLRSFDLKQQMPTHPLIESLEFKSVGPVIMSGRVTDVDVNAENKNEFFVAYASGGVWKTDDMGESFIPLFDHEPAISIGDIAVDWDHDRIIWVGTGENNSSRSSYAGMGVFKSTDQGKSWQNMGLNETNHIGRIVLHPENPDVVWVAAMGHLYSQNPERGVFKTTDGGKTWKKTLFVNNKTGAIDLVINPRDPDILYAAMWERQAWRWDRHENGSGSGIYKSTDGGESWENISSEDHGFPTGEYVGRIGLDIYPGNPDILYAYLDNQTPVEPKKKDKAAYHLEDFRNMPDSMFFQLDPEEFDKFLKKNRFPKSLNHAQLTSDIREGKYSPDDLLVYKKDTFNIPEGEVIGVEIYRTDNGGQNWYRTHEKNFDGRLMSYSYGYYFGEIRVFPDDPDRIIVGGLVISFSKNGGKKLRPQLRFNVHMDHHAFWISPKDPDFILNGNDGGLNVSTNGGGKWEKLNPIPVGQFYSINVDMQSPYNIYGGMQDNGVWMGPGTYDIDSNYVRKRKTYPYKRIAGGDGMEVEIEESDELWVYTGMQNGYYAKMHYVKNADGSFKKMKGGVGLRPRHTFGESVPRYNWKTPIMISAHYDSIFYLGTEKLYRSTEKGLNLKAVSDDLPRTVLKGDNTNGTITEIDESPLTEGVIYVGTDDGLVWVSLDSCKKWSDISGGLPRGYKVYSIDASAFHEGRAYMCMNGYYSDNFDPLVFKTEDFGVSWTNISSNLPMEPVNKILEDPKNENILYVGTDNGLYISLNGGGNYYKANHSLPYVPVHDIIVHPRENDLLVATHGRSIYKVNVGVLQQKVKQGE